MTGTVPQHLAAYTGHTSSTGARDREQAGQNNLSVSSVDGVAALERFSAEIDRLNLASARPNPFLSSRFLLCYALRIEYHTPGSEERLFLVRDGGRVIG